VGGLPDVQDPSGRETIPPHARLAAVGVRRPVTFSIAWQSYRGHFGTPLKIEGVTAEITPR